MKIAIVSGSYPPMRCGIGDYTGRLVESLGRLGVKASVYTTAGAGVEAVKGAVMPVVGGWGVRGMPRLAGLIAASGAGIAHIQYPTIGYGYRLGPQALALLLRLRGLRVVTSVHEFRHAHPLRRISLRPFFLFSDALVFTSEDELEAAAGASRLLGRRIRRISMIIPVGSNLPEARSMVAGKRKTEGARIAAFFGLFYPGKRVEDVVEAFGRASAARPDMKFRFIGDVHPKHREYFGRVGDLAMRRLGPERTEWVTGRSPEEVAEALAGADVCLLPYPDGASFRRTTLIASMSLGVPVVTTAGSATPVELVDGENVVFAEGAAGMAEALIRVVDDGGLGRRLSDGGRALADGFSWEKIAGGHAEVYRKVAGGLPAGVG